MILSAFSAMALLPLRPLHRSRAAASRRTRKRSTVRIKNPKRKNIKRNISFFFVFFFEGGSVTGLRKHQKAKQGKCNEKDPLLQHNCPECGKYFEKKGNMKVHVKTVHYGLKEFQCQKCELCFFTKRNLQVHEEKV